MTSAIHSEKKETGLPWLGSVPRHWIVSPIRYVARTVADRAVGSSNQVGLENIESWTGKFVKSDTEFEGQGIAFQHGDILFGKLRPYLAKVALAPFSGEAVGDFIVVRPSINVIPDFLYQFLLTPGVIQKVNSSTTGAKMPRTNWDALASIAIAVPPREEQIAVLQHIKLNTARIDALIGKKVRFIELLKEKRTAVITHAVTKGLDPSVPMKNSGVAWLGDVPAHWTVVQSRRLFRERKERAREEDIQFTASQKHGIISQAEFMEKEGRRIVTVDKGRDILKHIEPGDFLISMRSFQGGLEECRDSGCVSSAYVPLIPVKWILNPFFKYLFKSDSYIQALQSTSDLVRDGQALRFENFSRVPLPNVPISEQENIAETLDRETARIDTLIVKTERSIELLREKRSVLITAAVTGKIDVRNAA